jgi:2-polyprenyl-3-methyl-5-hydroxy-6-metoxy-1,4-benzoquinol methylase
VTALSTPQDVARLADDLFAGQGGFKVRLQRLRPFICPFESLLDKLPPDSRVLDIGCGAGLFLGLAARSDRRARGAGFDVDKGAIAVANAMARRSGIDGAVRFERRDVEEGYPEGPFDVAAMIDVMHHIPPHAQRGVFAQVAGCLRPGGLFIYKDIAGDDRIRATANRCHDLVFARQWVNYLPRQTARAAATEAGLTEVHYERANRLWYGHDFHVFQKG